LIFETQLKKETFTWPPTKFIKESNKRTYIIN